MPDPTQTTPDQTMPEIPAEAVEAAARAFEKLPDGTQFRERLTQLPEYGRSVVPSSELALAMLSAAQPALYAAHRKQVEAEIRERLLSDAAVDAAEATSSRRHLRSADERERYKERIRAVLTAALDTLEADHA